MSYKTDLTAKLGKLTLKNPVMPASGTYDYFDKNPNLFPPSELGAILLKTVHLEPREGNPMPRIIEVTGGMLNAVGIPSVGLDRFLEEQLPCYQVLHVPVVLSISGNQSAHYYQALKRIGNNPYLDAVEVNLSCPNVGSGLPFSSSSEELLRETLSPLRELTDLPLFAKLTPVVNDIRRTALVAEGCGVDALTVANTFPGMAIDIHKQAPVLGNVFGGLSGPCIKPQVMRLVYLLYPVVQIPIIACGGIGCAADAIEYFLAGASAVQVGSINFANPLAMPQIIAGIDDYLAAGNYNSLTEIIGLAHQSPVAQRAKAI